ncbi:hypothetical protein SteCoe_6687 [Stentor coeruleus]|uniref:Uncharacterized protein n=1 Tax=Stentor coeruleus TaxID=5963 RepID=A0A1R2CPC1_9CILI|nr:hypothetical protein SteCoe_6687 [Stentor coeruleus]
MRSTNYKLNENIEDIIQNMQSRIASLQNQHITFVSYCSNLIQSHCKNLQKEINSISLSRVSQQTLNKHIESLIFNYQAMTTSMGFSASTKGIQDALDQAQRRIVNLIKQPSESDIEKRVYLVFANLSEIVYRKTIRKQEGNSANQTMRSPRQNIIDHSGNAGKNFSYIMSENSKLKEKTMILEGRLSELEYLLNTKDKDIFSLTQSIEFARNSAKSSPDCKLSSISTSPLSSPIINDFKKKTALKVSSSLESGFNMEKFKQKLENLSNLLEKFAGFTTSIEENIVQHPELEYTLTRFMSAKKEIAFALKNIISNDDKKSDDSQDKSFSNEIIMLKSEICRLKAELNEKNEENIELSEQFASLANETKESHKEISISKQNLNKLEKENNELRLESIYIKSQIERLQKNNKILQESLGSRENTLKDFSALQAKYEEILSEKKSSLRPTLSMIFTSSYSILPKKKFKTILKIDIIQGLLIKSSQKVSQSNRIVRSSSFLNSPKSESEDFQALSKKMSIVIGEKNKVEEEFLLLKEKNISLQVENKNLMDKLYEAMEMCKILEEFMNKNHTNVLEVQVQSLISFFPVTSETNKGNIVGISQQEIFVLHEKLIEIENVLEMRKEENEELIDKNVKFEKLLEEKQSQIEDLQESNSKNMASVEKLKEELAKSLNSFNAISSLKSQLQEQVKFLNSSNDLVASQLKEKKKECEMLIEKLKEYQSLSFLSDDTYNWKTVIPDHITKVLNKFAEDYIGTQEYINSKLDNLTTKLISLISLGSSLKSYKQTLNSQEKDTNELIKEIKKLETERKKLLETRDKLITQCNSQSEEIISLKLEQEEKFQQKIEDSDYQIVMLQNQVKKLQTSELSLNKLLLSSTEKSSNLQNELQEKNAIIEQLTNELSQIKFKQSVSNHDPKEKYKDELYALKMKNIKLEQTIQDLSLNNEDLNKAKSSFASQLGKIDEERQYLERKNKDNEAQWGKEKESLQKSLDSFAKQLTGANLEIHNLKRKIEELQNSRNPDFSSPDEYKIHRAVEHDRQIWYLIESKDTHNYIWIEQLPFENTDEIKDPLPNLIKERASLQKLNSELCIENHKNKNIIYKIENLCKKEENQVIMGIINEGRNPDKPLGDDLFIRSFDKKNEPTQEFIRKPRSRGLKINTYKDPIDRKAMSEISDHEFPSNSIDSFKSNNEHITLQQVLNEKEEELFKKNDILRKNEISLHILKDQNTKNAKELEKFEHLKVLIAKLQLLNPSMNSECSSIMARIITLLELNKKNYKLTSKYS